MVRENFQEKGCFSEAIYGRIRFNSNGLEQMTMSPKLKRVVRALKLSGEIVFGMNYPGAEN